MKTKILLYWDYLRASYWFVPSLMAALALGAAAAAIYIDGTVGAEWVDGISILYRNEPDGARQLLSTVAGSMIGVAGVTFSITIASVVYASGHYGPRILSNFMADKGNQLTLGTFIATFLYCLMVLRTVRAEDESASLDAFVPHVAITLALVLAVASIAVLIYFIHHVPESIHVSQVVAGIGRELEARIDSLFPEQIGEGGDGEEADRQRRHPGTDAFPVRSATSGYVQSIDGDGLIELAARNDALFHIVRRPGDFVAVGDTLVAIEARGVLDSLVDAVRGAFTIGEKRTAFQDVRFPADELVEIAVRALSPGINDPFTAMACIGWLTAGYKKMAGRRVPSELRRDGDGHPRVVAPATSFNDLVDGTLSMLWPHAEREPSVLQHLRRSLTEVLDRDLQASRRAIIEQYVGRPRGGGDARTASGNTV